MMAHARIGSISTARASRSMRFAALVAALAMAWSARAHAATLVVRGGPWSQRDVAPLVQSALRMPGDSSTASRSLGTLVAKLQEEGYLDARATAAWSVTRDTLRVTVSEGPRYRFRSVQLLTAGSRDSAVLTPTIGIEPGAPASPSSVAAALDRAVAAAAETGYPYAHVSVSAWQQDSGAVRLVIGGALGPAVRITGVRFEGLHATKPGLLTRAIGPLGDVYRTSTAMAARDRVEQLGLFRSVELGDLEGGAAADHANLVLRVQEPTYSHFEGVVGSQGEGSIVGLANVELDNLAGTGRAAAVRWEGQGHGISNFSARYAEPLVLGLPVRLEGLVDQQVYDTLFTRSRGRIGGRWMMSGAEHLDTGVETERVVQGSGEVRQASTQTTRLGFGRARYDDLLRPRRGGSLRLEASQSFTRERLDTGDSRSVRASAVEAGLERLLTMGARSGLSIDLRAAGRFSSSDVLRLDERYPLGGAATLRGYDEEAFRVDRYSLSRLEWRWFLPARQHAFVFWDHATAWTRLETPLGTRPQLLQRDGYGIGLSLAASSGTIGVTYGVGVGNGPLEGKLHLQLISPF